MRRSTVISVVAVVMLTVSGWALAASGDGFDLSWFSIDGGGGESNGGGYVLIGTIGQPDVGGLSGGGYYLAGGFWPAQVPGAPADHSAYLPLILR